MAGIAPFVTIYLVFIGLMLGSFINLAADRLPRGESVISPRSHCRGCGRQLNAIDLAPVAGYLVRGGRCATCRTPIGASAPLVEFVAGACMVAAIAWQGLWPGGAIGLALVCLWGAGVIASAMRAHRRGVF
jgi:prepilin signal peptidase PulO-like enzyme (type II secretory pathway)